MKILYAAGNRKGAQLQLVRLLPAFENCQFKVAGYNTFYSPVQLDWTLNALQNMFDVEHISLDNDNLRIYCEQIKSFSPDLIISDLEIYTSYIGIQLNIPVWQVSSALLYYGLTPREKSSINIHRQYSYLFDRQNIGDDLLSNVLINSDKKYIYSHFGDVTNSELNPGYEWLRPYSVTGKKSIPCQHNVVSVTLDNDKKFIHYLKSFKDVVLFSSNLNEKFSDIALKDITNITEYACNLKNCNIGANQGYTDLLADLYYSGKYALIKPDFTQTECIVNALYSEYLQLGKVIYQNLPVEEFNINPKHDSKIQYLHDKLGK